MQRLLSFLRQHDTSFVDQHEMPDRKDGQRGFFWQSSLIT
jgi:hypothetical protein